MHASGATRGDPLRFCAALVRRTVVVHAFIYQVRPRTAVSGTTDVRCYCTVLALGSSVRQAEAIAINSVHQHGWHILRADTVTTLDATDVAELDDGRILLGELDRYGVTVRCLATPVAA